MNPSFLDHRGCRLAWKVTGDGPAILFIQGTGVHGDGWSPQVEAFRDRFSCLTFDNRGMGESQPADPKLSVAQMADDALAILDACGVESAHVVGHSLGGLVALQLALSARSRVRSLALLCTFSRGADATGLTWPKFWLGLRSFVGTRRMRRRAFLRIVMAAGDLEAIDPEDEAARLEPLFGHDLAVHPPVEMKQLAAMKRCDLTPRLGELAGLPTLVVGGELDLIARPAVVKALAGAIPGARLRELPGAAHGLPIHRAVEVNLALAAHFSRSD
ncbi:MAG TPA: alpha/beta fold hydrolase [Thermoanaerobaculia bacterium]|nr:alpha/beta fold hydrolase [Thermoanaerobaculia bacterium]